MGTELLRACLKEEDVDFPARPPGFEAFTSFDKLKKSENSDEPCCSVSSNLSQQESVNVKRETDLGGPAKIIRSLRRRSSTNPGRYNQCSDEESDAEQLDQNFPMKPALPKGVIRGCNECQNCQKVIARWQPEAACRADLEDVPVFYPSEEEFKDTIRYIEKIRPKAEQYGICRIIPPASWKPPCRLKEKELWEMSKFTTRVQKVDKLQNRDASKKLLKGHMRKKRRRCSRMGMECAPGGGKTSEPGETEFGFEPGPDFTLDEFQRYADDFKAQFFGNENCADEKLEPSLEAIEGEYWRVVEKPTEEIEVLYGADLETGVFGSGFQKMSNECSSTDDEYVKSGWNLNNLPRLPGSVLSYENADISGVQVPWLYIGMCFSSFCWHVEDHHLYSLNYLHFGAPKMWYGVPGSEATKLEDAMKKHLPDLFDEQPDLLHKLITQLSPSILKLAGVPVYRCVQNEGDFVLTFPRAYHAGFNTGFNCAEAVNLAPIDWFPHGQRAVELYREQQRKTTVSHDKLLLGAAREAVKANWELNLLRNYTVDNLRWKDVCGRDGILAKSLRSRVDAENVRREFLCKYSKAVKMDSSFDAKTERECSVCFYDLHLSAAGCSCSPDRFACLNHAKQMCSCNWDAKYFLFRYDITELNILVDALEGKLSAIYRWARSDLGLALSSCISKDKSQVTGLGTPISETSVHNPATKKSPQELVISKTGDISSKPKIVSSQKDTFPEVCLALEATKIPPFKLSRLGKRKGSTSLVNSVNGKDDVVCLSDDEDENSKKLLRDGVKGESQDVKGFEADHKMNLCDLANAALAAEASLKDECLSCSTSPNTTPDVLTENKACAPSYLKLADDARTLPGSPSCSQSTMDKYYRQKGPRIAKVVRRISCNVEPLEFGCVVPGKEWSTSKAIFLKGFKSRVRYISISDPTNMCYYVSEILDGGSKGPLFMVFLEQTPNEVFVQVSPTKCWETVRERVNQEISKQHKLGELKLPPLQPPGSLDGYEMFGFTSPTIVQAIEALDKNRVCTAYWSSRPSSQISHCSQHGENPINLNSLPEAGTETLLRALFKKANPEELRVLQDVLMNNPDLVTRILDEEMQSQSR
ncbi:putative lysine-specific demethylase JMJ16 [Silene latifolia]|uniref:putative lysine-specific demethylase JMJ16 n=1 Tax=Silene latifolia TaxID=37657 RepID=UPI003D781BA8